VSELKVGQIWQDVDPRAIRYARIYAIGTGRRSIAIRTVYKAGRGDIKSPIEWKVKPHSRMTYCDRERFNGKRGGYKLHEDVP